MATNCPRIFQKNTAHQNTPFHVKKIIFFWRWGLASSPDHCPVDSTPRSQVQPSLLNPLLRFPRIIPVRFSPTATTRVRALLAGMSPSPHDSDTCTNFIITCQHNNVYTIDNVLGFCGSFTKGCVRKLREIPVYECSRFVLFSLLCTAVKIYFFKNKTCSMFSDQLYLP